MFTTQNKPSSRSVGIVQHWRNAKVTNLFERIKVLSDSDEQIQEDTFVTVKMENGRLVKIKKSAVEYV